jgi:peroxiredoxin Q/BCP
MKKLLIGCVAGMFATALGGGGTFGAEPPQVGDMAPAFELPGSDGKTYKLADFKNKRAVVLAWFPKAFTAG